MSFDEPLEENVARMSPHSFAEAAVSIGRHSDCDAVFLSCTNLRTLDVIEEVNKETYNKPRFGLRGFEPKLKFSCQAGWQNSVTQPFVSG